MPLKTRGQLDPLTSMRGIAAVMVVTYHFTGSFVPNLNPAPLTGLVSKAYLWVDFFFVLSGFIMAHAYTETFRDRIDWPAFKAFILARVARIYPLHLMVLGGFLGLEFIKLILGYFQLGIDVDAPFGPGSSLFGFILNMLMLQTSGLQAQLTWNGPAWSVGAEFFAYLLFPFLSFAMIRASLWVRLMIGASTLLALALIVDVGGTLDVKVGLGLARCLIGFSIGILAQRLVADRPMAQGVFILCGCVAALLPILMHFKAPDILFPFAFACLILFLADRKTWLTQHLSNPVLVRLGEISYAVYMLHFLLQHVVQLTSRAVTGQRIGVHLDAFDSLLLVVSLGLITIWLADHAYERVEKPARLVLRKRALRPATAVV